MAKDAVNKGRKPFVPSKFGDGAAISSKRASKQVARKKRRTVHELDNSRVCLTGADPEKSLPTMDPFDRAHSIRNAAGDLRPSAEMTDQGPRISVEQSTPRRYPRDLCAVVTIAGKPVRIGVDSVFDATASLSQRLVREGLDVPGTDQPVLRALAVADSVMTADELRDILHPLTRQHMTAEELELHRQATRLLKTAGRSTA